MLGGLNPPNNRNGPPLSACGWPHDPSKKSSLGWAIWLYPKWIQVRYSGSFVLQHHACDWSFDTCVSNIRLLQGQRPFLRSQTKRSSTVACRLTCQRQSSMHSSIYTYSECSPTNTSSWVISENIVKSSKKIGRFQSTNIENYREAWHHVQNSDILKKLWAANPRRSTRMPKTKAVRSVFKMLKIIETEQQKYDKDLSTELQK